MEHNTYNKVVIIYVLKAKWPLLVFSHFNSNGQETAGLQFIISQHQTFTSNLTLWDAAILKTFTFNKW